MSSLPWAEFKRCCTPIANLVWCPPVVWYSVITKVYERMTYDEFMRYTYDACWRR